MQAFHLLLMCTLALIYWRQNAAKISMQAFQLLLMSTGTLICWRNTTEISVHILRVVLLCIKCRLWVLVIMCVQSLLWLIIL